MINSFNRLLAAALWYADLGYPVFPCAPGDNKPITKHGFKDASADPEQIERWWARRPSANIGIPTEGLLALDVDLLGGEPNPWLTPERQLDLARAPMQLTPGGGRHYLFRQPEGKHWSSTVSQLAPKIDIRASGGYIVVPPSTRPDGVYRWQETMALDVPPDQLPKPPPWLAQALDEVAPGTARLAQVATSGADANPIPEGQRNGALARLAGGMRRMGMSEAEILASLLRANEDRCRPSLAVREVERVAASIARYAPDEVSVALVENHWQQMVQAAAHESPLSVRDLTAKYPALRPPVIHGLIRQGETMNVIAPSKIGKSWLVTDCALAVATGRMWLDTFQTEPGDVLILDNELHRETSAHRIPRVAAARGVPADAYADRVFVHNMRGQLRDVFSLGPYFESLEPGRFRVVILDAFYRFMPKAMDENDNGTMASLYNHIDLYADRLGCSFILIHHTTKGNQSLKSVTDVGAGAGSQSRATDTHLVLRPHEETDAVVLDAAVRSWPPVMARCLRWVFPVWMPADDLDPARLRSERPKRRTSESKTESWTTATFVQAFVGPSPRTKDDIARAARDAGLSGREAQRMLRDAESSGLAHRWYFGSNVPVGYATVPQADGAEGQP